MIRNDYYGLRHDVWGLGVLTYFLFSGQFPFSGTSDAEVCENILKSAVDWAPFKNRIVDSKIGELVKGMLAKNPSRRLTIRQVMSHGLFRFLEKEESKVGEA